MSSGTVLMLSKLLSGVSHPWLEGVLQGVVHLCPYHPPSYAGSQKTPCGWGLVVVGRGVRSGSNDVVESSS
jgi:hypothetical protein